MINLYEFLGIEPTNDFDAIRLSIQRASAQGKDAKLIQASKSYLLNPEWKNKHDKHFGIEILAQEQYQFDEPVKDHESLVKKKNVITFKSAFEKKSNDGYCSENDEEGSDFNSPSIAEIISWIVFGIFSVSAVMALFGTLMSSSSRDIEAIISYSYRLSISTAGAMIFGMSAVFLTVNRKLELIISNLTSREKKSAKSF